MWQDERIISGHGAQAIQKEGVKRERGREEKQNGANEKSRDAALTV